MRGFLCIRGSCYEHEDNHTMVEHTKLAGTNQAVSKLNKAVPLLEVRNLKTHFMLQQGIVRAIDGVDFAIGRGQTVGLVGESGCGKSVLARSILRIVPPRAGLSRVKLSFTARQRVPLITIASASPARSQT